MKENFNENLNEWAEKAATQCYGIATSDDPAIRVDKSFYAFQSPPPDGPNPPLLIMGINPREDRGEDFAFAAGKAKTLPELVEQMKNANGEWDGRDKWQFWKMLKYYFEPDGLNEMLENCVYMNQIYFNTQNMKALYAYKGSANAIRVCRELTKELVFDVIRPKRVLCLGISDCFNGLGKGLDYREFLRNRRMRLFIKKICCDIPVYGIPHPTSAWGISREDRDAIRKCLLEELGKEDL
jgi:hypothetical protein